MSLGIVTRDAFIGKLTAENATILGSFLGAVSGLVGLLLGALYNAKLNRQRDDYLLSLDLSSYSSALKAEVQLITRNAESTLRSANNIRNSSGLRYPKGLYMDCQIYTELIPKIGHLGPDITYRLVELHGYRWSLAKEIENNGIDIKNADLILATCKTIIENSKALIAELNKSQQIIDR